MRAREREGERPFRGRKGQATDGEECGKQTIVYINRRSSASADGQIPESTTQQSPSVSLSLSLYLSPTATMISSMFSLPALAGLMTLALFPAGILASLPFGLAGPEGTVLFLNGFHFVSGRKEPPPSQPQPKCCCNKQGSWKNQN